MNDVISDDITIVMELRDMARFLNRIVMGQLENDIRDLITKATGAKYVSRLNVYEEDGF